MNALSNREGCLGMAAGKGSALALGLGTCLALAMACSKQDIRVLGSDRSCQADSQCAAPWSCFNGTCQDLRIGFLTPSGDRHVIDGLVQLQFELPGVQPAEMALEVNGVARGLSGLLSSVYFGAEGTYRLAGLARFGDRWARSQDREVVVDRTPPSVVWSLPPGQYELPASSRLQGTFSELLSASVTSATFGVRVDDSYDPSAVVTLSGDGMTVTVQLPRPLSEVASVEVVHGTIEDLAGNPLVPSTAWRWLQAATSLAIEMPPPVQSGYLSGVVPLRIVATGHPPTGLWLELSCGSGPAVRMPVGLDGRIALDTTRVAEGSCWMQAVAQVGSLFLYTGPQYFWVDNTPSTVRIEPRFLNPEHPDYLMVHSPIDVIFSEQMDAVTFGTVVVVVTDGAGLPLPFDLEVRNPAWAVAVNLRTNPAPGSVVVVAVNGVATDLAGFLMEPRSARLLVPAWLAGTVEAPVAGEQLILGALDPNGLLVLEKRSPGCDSFLGISVTGACRLGRPASTTAKVPTGSLTARAWTELDLAGHWLARLEAWWDLYRSPSSRFANRSALHDAHDVLVGIEDANLNPRPVIAWLEDDGAGATALFVSRINGGAWEPLGGDLAAGAPSDLAMAVVEGLGPVVAWREPAAGGERRILLRRWRGATWSAVEGPMERDLGSVSSAPRLTTGPGGELVLCWSESVAGVERAYVSTWTGAAWSVTSLADAGDPDATIDAAGRMVMTFMDPGTRQVRAAVFEGGAWVDMGHPDDESPLGPGDAPRLSVSYYDQLVLSWRDGTGAIRSATPNQ
jgi:hypothetical protein